MWNAGSHRRAKAVRITLWGLLWSNPVESILPASGLVDWPGGVVVPRSAARSNGEFLAPIK
jgi:hypothetical protein